MLANFLVLQSKLTVGLIVLTLANSALADVQLLDSFPQQGAKLSRSVTDVRVWFDQEPLPEGSELLLVHKGEEIPVIALHSMGEKDLMGFVQQPTPPGRYQLVWRVLTATSEQAQSGRIDFEIIAVGAEQ
jgi:methionine-rich copper-binding protein CopC